MPTDTLVALASPAKTIEGLIAVYEADRETFGGRTALNLPALTVSVRQMLDALEAAGGRQALARVRFERDEAVERIVGGWPARFESKRAERLGLRADEDFASIVRQYTQEQG